MPSHQGYQKVATKTVADSTSSSTPSDMKTSEGLPSTHSSQQLIAPSPTQSDASSVTTSLERNNDSRTSLQYNGFGGIRAREWFTVGVLCFVNLINYMDRFTIAGILVDIQSDFKIGDDQGGLLQTAFVLSYMICAPLFGYLGDRYSRRWIMALGVALWSGTTLIGSFMQQYGWFLTFRALVGVGEASYSTIAPTIISDLFISDIRSKMLAVFYFAIPVGSGLGYIIGSETAKWMESWRWALRVTPVLGLIAVVLIFLCKEPERGQSEGSQHMEATSYKEDLKDIVRNPSFMLSTAGFTCVAFVAGALAWWGPTFIHLGINLQPGNENVSLNSVSYKFGVIAMTSGLIGVPLGSYMAQRLRPRYPTCDPAICGIGLFSSAPFIFFALVLAKYNVTGCFFLVFFAEVFLNLCWSIVADILLYVVIPTRRSTAEAFQILISHAFGDAGSPYLVGVISEALKYSLRISKSALTTTFDNGLESLSQLAENATTISPDVQLTDEDSLETKFQALQYALFSTCFVEIIGGVFFLLTTIYILRDKKKAEKAVADSQVAEPRHEYADTASSSQ